MPELPELSILTHEHKDDLIRALYRRLVELEARVLKNSHDSGKPPFSDGLSRKPKSLRKQGRNVFHARNLAFQGQAPDPLPSG
ncbi:MAG: hypothetical protein HY525_06570 [Betaproteobacteria bacterium]|nr:hypothetical protein [Betaproteobacteria bacterium]